MHFGLVKLYLPDRGFGFCVNEAGGLDDFFHIRQLEASGIRPEAIVDGVTRLKYRLEERPNGRVQAVDIELVA